MKAADLIFEEKHFCRGNFAINSDHLFTNPRVNPETNVCKAEKWDIQGAIHHCYPYQEAVKLIEKAQKQLFVEKGQKYRNLADYNDSANHNEIYHFLKRVENA